MDTEKSVGDTRLTDGLPSERRFAESERGLGERRYVDLDVSYGSNGSRNHGQGSGA